jgi:hypothetical protein
MPQPWRRQSKRARRCRTFVETQECKAPENRESAKDRVPNDAKTWREVPNG